MTLSIDTVKHRNGPDLNKPLSAHEIDARRAGLLEAALSILEAEGVVGLTIRRLADAAGVSRQTPYLYFRDKADLCDALCVAGMRRLTASVRQSIDTAPVDDPIEQMRMAGEAYVRFGLENPSLYALIFRPTELNEVLSAEFEQAIEDNRETMRLLLDQAWSEGILNLEPERLNHVFWASLHGLISLRNDGLIAGDEQFATVLDDLEFILASGFLKKPGAVEL